MENYTNKSSYRKLGSTEKDEDAVREEDVRRAELFTTILKTNVTRDAPMPTNTNVGPNLGSSSCLAGPNDSKADSTENSNFSIILDPVEVRELDTPALTKAQQRELQLNFHADSQLKRLLLKGFINWLITTTILATLAGTMYWYSNQVTPLTDADVQAYNFLVVGLSIAIGLNLSSSLKQMSLDVRWWALSLSKRSLREVDLILHLDSLGAVTELAFVAPKLALTCFSWIFLAISAQVAISLISLCYSIEPMTTMALMLNGTVIVPDMARIYSARSYVSAEMLSKADQQYTANVFGEMAIPLFYGIAPLEVPAAGTISSPQSNAIFTGLDSGSQSEPDVGLDGGSDGEISGYWKYVFQDVNADTGNTAVFTNCSINATWSCRGFKVVQGEDGSTRDLTIALDHQKTETRYTPYAGGINQTTFITYPDSGGCGRRCSIVHAFEVSSTEGHWYDCNITMGIVHNATQKEHRVGHTIAQMAAAGIALSGKRVKPQYQSYPFDSSYGAPSVGDAYSVGDNIARFAIGVMAMAAQLNPVKVIVGDQPNPGSQLQVFWNLIMVIFIMTAGLQLLLFVAISLVSNLVVVKDHSAFATARLLRPIVDRLGAGGTYANGKKICKLLDDSVHEKVVYSVRHPQGDDLHRLDLGYQKRLRAFPEGDYA